MKEKLQTGVRIVSPTLKNLILMARGKPLKIIGVNFEVTDACNSRCKHCNIWRQKPTTDLLTSEEIEKTFSDDLFSELKEVQLTGGEPVLRDDLEEIMLTIHKVVPRTNISFGTNGLLPERVIDVVKVAIKHDIPIGVGIALDGVGEKHDLIRGVKGNFEKTDYLLHELAKLREKHRDKLSFAVGHTLSNMTVGTVEETIKYVHSLNIDFLEQIYDEAPYYHNIGSIGIEKLDDSGLRKVIQQLPPSFHNELLLKGLEHKAIKFRCFAMRTFFSLRCNGDIKPCLRYGDIRVGNVRENSFSEIWHSPAAEEARRLVKNCEGCLNTWATDWSFQSYFPSLFGLVMRAVIKSWRAGESKRIVRANI